MHHVTAIASNLISGMYRLTIPLRAMIEAQVAVGNVFVGLPQELNVTNGSVLVLQDPALTTPALLAAAKRGHCRIILDFDDLSVVRKQGDIPSAHTSVRALLSEIGPQLCCADMVTASNGPLAAGIREGGYTAAFIPSVLDPRDWTMQPIRAKRKRPRVALYAGRLNPAESASLVSEVVHALIDEADFVFFDDPPASLSNLRARLELVRPVPLSMFATYFSVLDLDIVLVPREDNNFNECASNLPLLQAGILGYPVIATDIAPHRTLPVTRLPNAPLRWIAAIRERIHDTKERQREGDALRSAIHDAFLARAWMQRSLSAWTGTSMLRSHA